MTPGTECIFSNDISINIKVRDRQIGQLTNKQNIRDNPKHNNQSKQTGVNIRKHNQKYQGLAQQTQGTIGKCFTSTILCESLFIASLW